MSGPARIALGDFLIDPQARRLWHRDVAVPLRPKPWDLLLFLLERPGQVLLKDEIAAVVWPDVAVGEDSITKAVRELRAALGDDARRPRFLETVHRVGFRLIADALAPVGAAPAAPAAVGVAPGAPAAGPLAGEPKIAGRTGELAALAEALADARRGTRRTVFLSGEGGIGKSTVMRAFVDQVAYSGLKPRILFGQSAEGMALADAYAPLLDALATARADDAEIADLLARVAPSWLAQLPDGGGASAKETSPRMLREGVLLLEALAAKVPLVVVVEDAHSADHATIELLATLAARPSPARLLVLATFRRAEAVAARHPVASVSAELEIKGFARILVMEPFAAGEAQRVLELRFGRIDESNELEALLLHRSGGNPLFLTALIDHLVSSGSLVEEDGVWRLGTSISSLPGVVPDRLRLIVNAILARLDPATAEMLEAAAIAGHEFDARSVAAALGRDAIQVESACYRLAADGQLLFFRDEVAWRDGTHGARYEFLHQIYKDVLYSRVSPSKRRVYHLRVAERLEAGAEVATIEGELAMHFARGGDHAKAVRFLLRVAERANRRGAYRDAIAALRQALGLLDPEPADERDAYRLLRVQATLSGSVMFQFGFGNPELAELFANSRRTADRIGARPWSCIAELGLFTIHLVRCETKAATAAAAHTLEIAETLGVPMFVGAALGARGWAAMLAGEFCEARARFDEALALDVPDFDFDAVGALGAMPEMRSFSLLGRALTTAILGDEVAPLADTEAAIRRVDAGRSTERIDTLSISSAVFLILGDDARAERLAAETCRLLEDHGEKTPWSGGVHVVSVLCAPAFSVDAFRLAIDGYDSQYRWFGAMFRLLAAERLVERGDLAEAASLLDGVEVDAMWRAVELRVKAVLMWKANPTQRRAAERMLRESCTVARAQFAARWERQAADALESCLGDRAS